MKPLLFIHIPKTAGTSLNKAAEKLFNSTEVEQDYGVDSGVTTSLVRDNIYSGNGADMYALHEALKLHHTRWLTGHFPANRYAHLFGAQHTISIVRDPIDRVISEYQHLVSKENARLSFEAFYRDPDQTNKQFRMIGQLPWQAFHMVGTQEKFEDSLNLLNQTKKLALSPFKANKSSLTSLSVIDEETRADIQKWNERDCIFVQQVRDYLEKQIKTHQQNKAFCFHDIGFEPDKHVIGWAFYQNDQAPVEIGLFIDKGLAETTFAHEHRSELQSLHTPRAGHNGFRFVLAPYTSAQSISIKALNTDQTLFEWQRQK